MKTSVASSWDVDSILRVGMQSLLDLFDDSCEGTLAVDDQGRIAWINDKYVTFLGLNPPCQNTCHLDRTKNPGAMKEERIGTIRTGIQGQSSSTAVAA